MAATVSEIESQYDPPLVSRQTMVRRLARLSFIQFIRCVAPWFIVEEAHLLIAEKLEALAEGRIDRLMIFMPPRTGKSLMVSVFFPAWYLGRFTDRKVMQVSYKTELAVGFGRQVRNMIRDPDYQSIFPGVGLVPDNKAAGRWAIHDENATDRKRQGEYFAVGIESGIAGKGFNLGIIDDPLSEQDAISKVTKDRIWEWYGPGFYTRRQPDHNGIVVMSTRWANDDLPGRLLAAAKDNADDEYADKWEVLKIPAVIGKAEARRLNSVNDNALLKNPLYPERQVYEKGGSFAPRRWPTKELLRQKGNMRNRAWVALYQQEPVEDDGNILRRSCWRRWPGKEPPECEYLIQVYDTAFEETEENDFSARTTWGVFEHSDTGDPRDLQHHVILLERMRERLSFPLLRDEAKAAYKEHRPDRVIIEKRASGHSLIQELRRAEVPIYPFNPRNKSKLARAHVASNVLEQGAVWYMPRNWADDVIDECAQFPFGEHDDITDTCVMAWIFLRRMFWLDLRDDPVDDAPPPGANVHRFPARKRSYG